jgi:hypothetical protein
MSEGQGVLAKLNLAVTLVLAVVAGLTKFAADRADERVKQLDAKLKEQEATLRDIQERRAERESVQKVQIEVYQQVVTSLEKNRPEMQRVAAALVTSLLDEPLRGGLLNALATTAEPSIAQKVRETLTSENVFRRDESVTAQPEVEDKVRPKSFSWEDVDYDVFWCERSGEAAKRMASRIVAQLKEEGARGRLRVRMLPDSINARPGYQHSGFVIRMNPGEELQASQLKRVCDAALTGAGTFHLSLSAQNTPWYLSAFVCPAA